MRCKIGSQIYNLKKPDLMFKSLLNLKANFINYPLFKAKKFLPWFENLGEKASYPICVAIPSPQPFIKPQAANVPHS
jgi:hypothetical protein